MASDCVALQYPGQVMALQATVVLNLCMKQEVKGVASPCEKLLALVYLASHLRILISTAGKLFPNRCQIGICIFS
jgi:hypothetical protein